jgi:hypothetical protein
VQVEREKLSEASRTVVDLLTLDGRAHLVENLADGIDRYVRDTRRAGWPDELTRRIWAAALGARWGEVGILAGEALEQALARPANEATPSQPSPSDPDARLAEVAASHRHCRPRIA